MNPSLHTCSATPIRGLPSARVLALMAMHLHAPEARADLRVGGGLEASRDDAAGPGWFESSFELERGLQVVEGTLGLDGDLAGLNCSAAWLTLP